MTFFFSFLSSADRHKQHYNGTEEKFNTADFNKVIVIFSVHFNRSALDDVESQLITYFTADNYEKAGAVSFDNDDVINRTGGNSVNEYVGIENVASEVILPVWEKELFPRGWVIEPDIRVNEDGVLEAVPDNHNNINNKFSAEEMTDPTNQFEFTLYILNQYYVILTRGIDGIRLGFWGNDAFRKYMEETLDVVQEDGVVDKEKNLERYKQTDKQLVDIMKSLVE